MYNLFQSSTNWGIIYGELLIEQLKMIENEIQLIQ